MKLSSKNFWKVEFSVVNKDEVKLDQLINGLRSLASKVDNETYDHEEDHIAADKLLLEYINNEEVVALFNKIMKWYS